MIWKLVIVSLPLVFWGCGPFPEGAKVRKIIGDNDLRPVEGMDWLTPAIGYIAPVGCTVTHIGDGLALTAGHCLGGYTKKDINQSCYPFRLQITWGMSLDMPNGRSESSCTRILERVNDGTLDYALIKVEPSPIRQLKVQWDYDSVKDTRISIYSHPEGRPLEWSGHCRILEKLTTGPFYYTCDTERGSSGAPVLNRHFELIGIHAFETYDRNGGSLLFRTSLKDWLSLY